MVPALARSDETATGAEMSLDNILDLAFQQIDREIDEAQNLEREAGPVPLSELRQYRSDLGELYARDLITLGEYEVELQKIAKLEQNALTAQHASQAVTKEKI